MSTQFSFLLLLGALLLLTEAHSGHSCPPEEQVSYSWEEAEGYEECEEFLANENSQNFDTNDLNELGNEAGVGDHFRRQPKPKPLDEICGGSQCPMFQKVESAGCGYEERILFRANWTVTPIDLQDPDGYRDAYFRLHGYRSGAKNDRGQAMNMAVPVVKRWWLNENFEILGATMSFYIPPGVQSDPPASTDDQVTVEEWDEAVIYSRAYGGNRQDMEHLKQFNLLEQALDNDNISPYRYMRMTAGFTRPGCGRQRREVILVDSQYYM